MERARALGSNCFRLSLEWHRIEPAKGQIDEAAVQRYHDMFECMKRWGQVLVSRLYSECMKRWGGALRGPGSTA